MVEPKEPAEPEPRAERIFRRMEWLTRGIVVVEVVGFVATLGYLAWFELRIAALAVAVGAAFGWGTARFAVVTGLLRTSLLVIAMAGLVGVATGNLFGAWHYASILAVFGALLVRHLRGR